MHLVAKTWKQHVHKEFDSGQTSFHPKKGIFADDCRFVYFEVTKKKTPK